MGNYRIVIEGIGAHGNNGDANDADVIAAEAVGRLRRANHSLTRAEFINVSIVSNESVEGARIDLRTSKPGPQPGRPPAQPPR